MRDPQVKIYGPDGRIITKRTPQMEEFDRRLRQQMSDNGGQFFAPGFIDSIKRNIDRREQEHRRALEAAAEAGVLDQFFER